MICEKNILEAQNIHLCSGVQKNENTQIIGGVEVKLDKSGDRQGLVVDKTRVELVPVQKEIEPLNDPRNKKPGEVANFILVTGELEEGKAKPNLDKARQTENPGV